MRALASAMWRSACLKCSNCCSRSIEQNTVIKHARHGGAVPTPAKHPSPRRSCNNEPIRSAANTKSFPEFAHDARIAPAIVVIGDDGGHIDPVVVFLYKLNVGRKSDWLRRPQRQREAPNQFFLSAVRNILRGGHVFALL